MSDKNKKHVQSNSAPEDEAKQRGHYDKPLQVKGDFMDFISVVIKDAKKKDKVSPSKTNSKNK